MNVTRTQIMKYAKGDRPFFLAYGAHRPHLPWNVPIHFWDIYNDTSDVALPKNQAGPTGMPPIAFTYECDGQTTVHCLGDSAPIPYPAANTKLPDNMTRSLRRGCVVVVLRFGGWQWQRRIGHHCSYWWRC